MLQNIVIKHLLICWFCYELTNYWVVFYYLFGVIVLLSTGSVEPILQDISSPIPAGPILQNEPSPILNPTSLCSRSVHKYPDTCFFTKKNAPTPFNFILKCYSKTFILEIFLFERDITCIWYMRYHLVVIRIWRIRILITWSLKVFSIGYLIHG